jgi:hypothetical protein
MSTASGRNWLSIEHPADWTEESSDHVWTMEKDAAWPNTGAEKFLSPDGHVAVGAWSVVGAGRHQMITAVQSAVLAFADLFVGPDEAVAVGEYAVADDVDELIELAHDGRVAEPVVAYASAAKSALDRIVIPQEVLDRIASAASPRSSLIISDEALSPETGKGTEFVAVLSNEPQGGLAIRRRSAPKFRYERQRERPIYWRAPFGAPFSFW